VSQTVSAKFFSALILAGSLLTLQADETLPTLSAGGTVYSNVTVTTVSVTDVYFTYAGGMANVKLKTLSPDLQKHFSFDKKKAQAAELQQAENRAKYHDLLVHQPAVRAPDMTRIQPAGAAGALAMWRNDFPGARKQAQAENKQVLLDFTGSDWCPWCIKFDQEVLSTGKFAAYAGQRLELVKVDFPRHTPLPEDQKQANDALKKHFNVDGYPTYVLLDSTGKELGRQVGYRDGGPDAFIAELVGFSRQ
jgi:protein disulfide-isomerase